MLGSMRRLYIAPDPLQAHVLRGALEAAGIAAEVRGSYIFGARGEAPVTTETAPTVWIPEDADFEVAAEIVREFEAAPEQSGPISTWRCACGEFIEKQFSHCWRCGTSKGDGALFHRIGPSGDRGR